MEKFWITYLLMCESKFMLNANHIHNAIMNMIAPPPPANIKKNIYKYKFYKYTTVDLQLVSGNCITIAH